MPKTIIVVPCHNEARRLDRTRFERFVQCTREIDILFVDDGSRDETLPLLQRIQATEPARFAILPLETNRGKAEAVRRGFLRAFEDRADFIGFWDADLATPLDEISAFRRVLEARGGIEVVIGTRIGLLGHSIERRRMRKLLGHVFARVASLVLGIRVYDTQCGAKLFRNGPRLRQVFDQPFITNWIFDVEILARWHVARRAAQSGPLAEAIYECPLDQWRDVAGSHVKSRDFLRAVGELSHIYWKYLRPAVLGGPHASADIPWPAPVAPDAPPESLPQERSQAA